jgi:probable rRNA maturation factor
MQVAVAGNSVPPQTLFERAAQASLLGLKSRAELTVRVVGKVESRQLNQRFRNVAKATNVLSFAVQGLKEIAPDFLGDVVLCGPLVIGEARAQGKTREAHFTHLMAHGVLHLLGFDHLRDEEAEIMEDRERAILSSLGFDDPYSRISE